jgi:hypothetical protein
MNLCFEKSKTYKKIGVFCFFTTSIECYKTGERIEGHQLYIPNLCTACNVT